MARSQNIDNLRFTNFKVADDSIVVNFNQTKMDKEGKKTTPKHCYANPLMKVQKKEQHHHRTVKPFGIGHR